jgi:hypothetical protein
MTKKTPPTLKLEQAMQHMRAGAKLVHMHGRLSDTYHWFLIPGGPVTNTVASKLLDHPAVVGGKDGLFPQHDQTWSMSSFVP